MSEPTIDDVYDLEEPGSDGVVATRLSFYGAAVDEPQRLGTFTDEELAGLEELGRTPLAPSPWLTSLPEAEQVTALTAALRGLSARGVYQAEPVDPETGEFVYRALPQILAVLSMRRHTACVVVAERQLAHARDWVVLYEQRAGLWLAEYVTHVGLHDFVLATAEDTAEGLTAWSGARLDVAAPELDLVLTREQVAAQAAELEPVGRSTAAVTITRIDVGETADETWTGVFTGPEGSYVSAGVPDGDDIRYRGAARDDVRDHWLAVVGAP